MTYKNTNYRVMRSSFGTVNVVHVFWDGETWSFPTNKRAKAFITTVTCR